MDPAQILSQTINEAARSGQPQRAAELVRTGSDVLATQPEAHSHALRAAMVGLKESGHGALAVDLYEDAVARHGLRPTSFVLTQLSKSATFGSRWQSRRAVGLLLAAVRDGAHLDPPALGAALHACAHAAESEAALELFALVYKAGAYSRAERGAHAAACRGDTRTSRTPAYAYFPRAEQRHMLASVLTACARARDVPRALAAHRLAQANGLRPDVPCFNALLQALGRGGQAQHVDEAVAVFEQALQLGSSEGGGGDGGGRTTAVTTTTLNTVLSACAHARRTEQAFALQRQAAAHGVEPDGVTITTLILACAHAPNGADGARALRTMRAGLALGIRPDKHTLLTLERAVLGSEPERRSEHDGALHLHGHPMLAELDALAAEVGGEGSSWAQLLEAAGAERWSARRHGSRDWHLMNAEGGTPELMAEREAEDQYAAYASAFGTPADHQRDGGATVDGFGRDARGHVDDASGTAGVRAEAAETAPDGAQHLVTALGAIRASAEAAAELAQGRGRRGDSQSRSAVVEAVVSSPSSPAPPPTQPHNATHSGDSADAASSAAPPTPTPPSPAAADVLRDVLATLRRARALSDDMASMRLSAVAARMAAYIRPHVQPAPPSPVAPPPQQPPPSAQQPSLAPQRQQQRQQQQQAVAALSSRMTAMLLQQQGTAVAAAAVESAGRSPERRNQGGADTEAEAEIEAEAEAADALRMAASAADARFDWRHAAGLTTPQGEKGSGKEAGMWAAHEDRRILEKAVQGASLTYQEIAAGLPGRSVNQVRKRFVWLQKRANRTVDVAE